MENAAVKTSGTYSNPLGEINLNWNEAAMNASMESVLTGYGIRGWRSFSSPAAATWSLPAMRATDGRPEGAIPWNPSGDGVLA